MIRLLHYPWIVQLSGALAVTVRCPRNRPRGGAANSQYGAATRRRAAVPARRRGAPLRTPVGDVRQLRGGGLGYGLAGRGLACCSGQSRSFRRFAAGVRWSPARSPSMP